MARFKALKLTKTDAGQTAEVVDFDEAELMEGDVTVRVTTPPSTTRMGLPSPARGRWCGAGR